MDSEKNEFGSKKIKKLFEGLDKSDHEYLAGCFFKFAALNPEMLFASATLLITVFVNKFGAETVQAILEEKTGIQYHVNIKEKS